MDMSIDVINGAIETYMYTIRLSTGLIILMGVNIVLGTINSLFESEFDVIRFFKGIGRAIILVICFSAVFFAGILNKDTLSIDMGTDVPAVDIIDALHAMLLAGYFLYSKQVLQKMNHIVGGGWMPTDGQITPRIVEAPIPMRGSSELTPANEEEGEYT